MVVLQDAEWVLELSHIGKPYTTKGHLLWTVMFSLLDLRTFKLLGQFIPGVNNTLINADHVIFPQSP